MRIEVGPPRVELIPGEPATVIVQVLNTDSVINAYEARVFGVDQDWLTLDAPPQLSLFPGAAGAVAIEVRVPDDYPAGELVLGVEVAPVIDGAQSMVGQVTLVVAAKKVATAVVDPVTLVGGRRGSFTLTLENEGNTPFDITLGSIDPEAKVTTTFVPAVVEVVPGEQVTVPIRMKARRPFLGNPAARVVTITYDGTDHPIESIVSFVQRPLLGRSLISMFGLLVAITVFALVLTSTLGRVADVASIDEALLKRAVEGEPDTSRGVPANAGSVVGTVTDVTSGDGIQGVTVELFDATDASKPVKSAASSETGLYTLAGLDEGTYKIRFRGAGFTERWFEDALTFEDATEVDVVLGETTSGTNMAIGGLPATIAGSVIGDDVADALVTLLVPGAAIESDSDAQIAEVAVGDDGAFVLEDVPAPASYVLQVSKPGFATTSRDINVLGGEVQENVEVRLRRGDGLIAGVVTSDDLPVGGVTITASNGAEELTTLSLTTGDLGAFALRNLPTPATYTITFAADGYATENLSLALDAAQQVTDLEVELVQGTGSIGGLVRLDGGAQDLPVGGVTVTVAGADVELVTESLSVGAIGTYLVTGLPLPGTYTVTFSGAGYATQVRSVDLEPPDRTNETGVDATMTASTATVSGTVEDPGGPVSGVTVVLTDGTVTLTTTTADDPLGDYALPGVPPGTYTVTFSRIGAVPKSVLITVGAGESARVDIELERQATISGTVYRLTDGDETPLSGAQVLVYTVEGFPGEVAGSAITDEDGHYTITDLEAPLEYIVEFAFPEGALAQVSERVTLDAGEAVDDMDATLVLAGDEADE